MNQSQIRNLDLHPDYYGLNSATKKVLEERYPTFTLTMTPADYIYTNGEEVNVSIRVHRFMLNGRSIIPDKVTINGVEIGDSTYTETIAASKQYDVEVTYKGYTSIRTRTICIIYPAYVLFSSQVSVPDFISATKVKAIERSVHKVEISNASTSNYLWVAIPSASMNLVEIVPVGVLEALPLEFIEDDGGYKYWRSVDPLTEGMWQFLVNIDAEVRFGYCKFTTYQEGSLQGIDFITKDGKQFYVLT